MLELALLVLLLASLPFAAFGFLMAALIYVSR
jgi:hypothetical protein